MAKYTRMIKVLLIATLLLVATTQVGAVRKLRGLNTKDNSIKHPRVLRPTDEAQGRKMKKKSDNKVAKEDANDDEESEESSSDVVADNVVSDEASTSKPPKGKKGDKDDDEESEESSSDGVADNVVSDEASTPTKPPKGKKGNKDDGADEAPTAGPSKASEEKKGGDKDGDDEENVGADEVPTTKTTKAPKGKKGDDDNDDGDDKNADEAPAAKATKAPKGKKGDDGDDENVGADDVPEEESTKAPKGKKGDDGADDEMSTSKKTNEPSMAPAPSVAPAPSGLQEDQLVSSAPTIAPKTDKSKSKKKTSEPTIAPESDKIIEDAAEPSSAPTDQPTVSPSNEPTKFSASTAAEPSSAPTGSPSDSPTYQPSVSPSKEPSKLPTESPISPTVAPTLEESDRNIEEKPVGDLVAGELADWLADWLPKIFGNSGGSPNEDSVPSPASPSSAPTVDKNLEEVIGKLLPSTSEPTSSLSAAPSTLASDMPSLMPSDVPSLMLSSSLTVSVPLEEESSCPVEGFPEFVEFTESFLSIKLPSLNVDEKMRPSGETGDVIFTVTKTCTYTIIDQAIGRSLRFWDPDSWLHHIAKYYGGKGLSGNSAVFSGDAVPDMAEITVSEMEEGDWEVTVPFESDSVGGYGFPLVWGFPTESQANDFDYFLTSVTVFAPEVFLTNNKQNCGSGPTCAAVGDSVCFLNSKVLTLGVRIPGEGDDLYFTDAKDWLDACADTLGCKEQPGGGSFSYLRDPKRSVEGTSLVVEGKDEGDIIYECESAEDAEILFSVVDMAAKDAFRPLSIGQLFYERRDF